MEDRSRRLKMEVERKQTEDEVKNRKDGKLKMEYLRSKIEEGRYLGNKKSEVKCEWNRM